MKGVTVSAYNWDLGPELRNRDAPKSSISVWHFPYHQALGDHGNHRFAKFGDLLHRNPITTDFTKLWMDRNMCSPNERLRQTLRPKHQKMGFNHHRMMAFISTSPRCHCGEQIYNGLMSGWRMNLFRLMESAGSLNSAILGFVSLLNFGDAYCNISDIWIQLAEFLIV